MDSSNPELSAGAKRKRTPMAESGPNPSMHSLNTVTQINYLARAKSEKLKLIEGDSDTFSDVLALIDDYEGVLQRHESLAANMGAKLVGPLLLKSFEKLFDGPINVLQTSFALDSSPVTWLDIVTFARANPSELRLTESPAGPAGVKSCRFWINGGHVEISEDDYRLIMSGGPERMIPVQPLAEDESAELGTLNILESRLAILIRKADTVASKARQLNYHLKGRKAAISSRKAAVEQPSREQPERNYSPQPFPALNARSPASPSGDIPKIQQQLLEQFLTTSLSNAKQRTSIALPRTTSRPTTTIGAPQPSTSNSSTSPSFHHGVNIAHSNSTNNYSARRLSHPLPAADDGIESHYRILMASKIEKLAKGDTISPPCDRCRRLRYDCTKHLTACTACTKKHAKCSWRDVKENEVELMSSIGGVVPASGQGSRASSENALGNNTGYISVDGL